MIVDAKQQSFGIIIIIIIITLQEESLNGIAGKLAQIQTGLQDIAQLRSTLQNFWCCLQSPVTVANVNARDYLWLRRTCPTHREKRIKFLKVPVKWSGDKVYIRCQLALIFIH